MKYQGNRGASFSWVVVAFMTTSGVCLDEVPAQEFDWARFSGGGYAQAECVRADPQGGALAILRGGSPFKIGELVLTNEQRYSRALVGYKSTGAVTWMGRLESHAFNAGPPDPIHLARDRDGQWLVGGAYRESLTWDLLKGTSEGTNQFAPRQRLLESSMDQDVFLARVRPGVGVTEYRALGGPGFQTLTGLALVDEGEVALSGVYRSGVWLGPPDAPVAANQGVWVGRLRSDWSPRWIVRVGAGVSPQEGPKLAVDSAGNVVVAGVCIGPLTFDFMTVSFAATQNVYVAKFSPEGQLMWVVGWGYGRSCAVHAVVVDVEGHVHVAAGLAPWASKPAPELVISDEVKITSDAYVVKLDSSGRAVWARPGGFESLRALADGRVFGAGRIEEPRSFGDQSFAPLGRSDIVLASWDGNGTFSWARTFSDSWSEAPFDIDVGPEGSVWLAGEDSPMGGSLHAGANLSGTMAMVARWRPADTALPRILRHPEGTMASAGEAVTLKIEMADSEGLFYEWLKQGVPLSDSVRLDGTKTSTLRIHQVEREDEGDYAVRVGNAAGTVLSQPARLRVLAPIQFSGVEPLDQSTVQLTFEGTPGFVYRFEASDDLVRWSHLTNSPPNGSRPGQVRLVDRVEPGSRQRFYRARIE